MTDHAQPADEPYAVGDRVRVRTADPDAESEFDGRTCRVEHVFTDGPDATEDGRETARAAYRLTDAETGDPFPVVFRHRDLVRADG